MESTVREDRGRATSGRRGIKKPRMTSLGQLRPDCVYDVRGVMRAIGFGNEILRDARRSGIVRPITVGRKLVYLGRELIAWIETLPRVEPKIAE